jgi:hypothetical protein
MNDIQQLTQQAERLERQVEALRVGVAQLRDSVEGLKKNPNGGRATTVGAERDCLVVALSVARDLGGEFSAHDPHGLADRGVGRFSGAPT